MVEDNIKLAYHALKIYRRKFDDLDPEEILSACYIGLIRAVQKYDSNRGEATFSTYAMKTMYRQIIMELFRGKKQVEPIYLEDIVIKGEDATFWQDVIGSGEVIDDEMIHKMLGEQLMGILDNIDINDKYREIVKTHYRDPKLTQRALGKIVGRDCRTVGAAYKQAKEKLKPFMEEI